MSRYTQSDRLQPSRPKKTTQQTRLKLDQPNLNQTQTDPPNTNKPEGPNSRGPNDFQIGLETLALFLLKPQRILEASGASNVMSNKRPFVSRNSRTFGERLLASCQGSTSATTFSLTSATGCRATTGAQTTPRSSPSSAHHASVLSRHRDPRAHLLMRGKR